MKTYNFKNWSLFLCFTILTLTFSCSKEDNEDNGDGNKIESPSSIENEILKVVNAHRNSVGDASLSTNTYANQVAKAHNEYMIDEGKISYDNSADRIQDFYANINGLSRVAEAVANRYNSAESLLEAWLKNATIKKNIETDDYTHTGISAIKDNQGTYYFTQILLKIE